MYPSKNNPVRSIPTLLSLIDHEIKACNNSPEITKILSQDLNINLPNSMLKMASLNFLSIPYSEDLNKTVLDQIKITTLSIKSA